MLNHPQEDRTTMKTYVRGTKTQAQGRPRKAGHVSKSVGKSTRRSGANAATMGAGSGNARMAGANGAKQQAKRPAQQVGRTRITLERKPWLRCGIQVITTDRRWRILTNCEQWNGLHRKAKAAGYKNALTYFVNLLRAAAKGVES